jgi:hypothetical protein
MHINKFIERYVLALIVGSLIAINSFAQRKMTHTDRQQESKTVAGILYNSSGGEHIREKVT